MQHLSELHIEQFRGLHHLKLQGLGQINMLVGANNSGKTSVLEAIAIFCRPLDMEEWIKTARRRELMLSNVPIVESLKWCFPQIGSQANDSFFKGEIALSGQGHFPLRWLKAQFREIKSSASALADNVTDTQRRGADFEIWAGLRGLTSNETVSATFQLWEDEPFTQREKPAEPLLPVKTITPHAHRVERLQMQQLTETELDDVRTMAVTLLQKFDPDVDDVRILSPSGKHAALYIKHKRLGMVPLSEFGDGMRRVLLIATTLPLCRNGVLLIDELETAIHTQLLEQSFNWLVQSCVQHNIQLVATTHSLEALDAILMASTATANLITYRLQSDSNGIRVIRFEQELLMRLREGLGREVRW